MNPIYDVGMREDDFVLYIDGNPLLTPAGNPVSHHNARLLRLAVAHEMISDEKLFTPLSFLIKLADLKTDDAFQFSFPFSEKLQTDPLLNKSGNAGHNIMDVITTGQVSLSDFIFMNSSSLVSALESFLIKKDADVLVNDYITECILKLGPEQKVVFDSLAASEDCGLLIHYLLLNNYLSIDEYATGLLILKIRHDDSEVVGQLKTSGIKGLKNLHWYYARKGRVAVDFLTLCKTGNQLSVIEEIIKRGEDNETEFKSTLRWDLRQDIKNAAIEHASLKTICAFLNSEGGDLLIGVRDDGSVEGIETDKFDNDDRFLLHLWTLIKTCMGQEVVEWVKTSLQKFGDKTVCRVNCKKARKPVFLNQKGFEEAFFIRVGPSSSNLEISSALKYIQQHF